MTALNWKYSDLRPLDTVIWRPERPRVKQTLLNVFGTSSFTEVAVYLGQFAQGVTGWFVPGRTTRICAIPDEALHAPEVYALRPRGQSKAVLHDLVVEEALEMAAEPTGTQGRFCSVDRWSNFVMWLPFKVDSVIHLWSLGLTGFETMTGEFDSFEALLPTGKVEETGRS